MLLLENIQNVVYVKYAYHGRFTQRPLKLRKDTYRYAAPGVASKPGRANSLRPKLVGPARLLH